MRRSESERRAGKPSSLFLLSLFFFFVINFLLVVPLHPMDIATRDDKLFPPGKN